MDLSELDQFTGTEHYYKFHGMMLTDGIKYMAEKCKAFWLLDIVWSWQNRYAKEHFQIWTLEVKEDKSALIYMRTDSDKPKLVQQETEFTDFPIVGTFEFYVIDRVVLLKSEY